MFTLPAAILFAIAAITSLLLGGGLVGAAQRSRKATVPVLEQTGGAFMILGLALLACALPYSG